MPTANSFGPRRRPTLTNSHGSSRPPRRTGRFAYLGFTNVWYPEYYDAEYNEVKSFAITDRPVYRPKQTVKFKFWVRHAKYDQPDISDFANQNLTVEIHDPAGEKVFSKAYTADAFGGIEGELALPADAKLGVYQIDWSCQSRLGGQLPRGRI